MSRPTVGDWRQTYCRRDGDGESNVHVRVVIGAKAKSASFRHEPATTTNVHMYTRLPATGKQCVGGFRARLRPR